MIRLYVSSSNKGKLRDFAAIAAQYPVGVLPVPGVERIPTVEEDAPTFESNAQKKAEHYSRYCESELVIADDSGLEVEALHGGPGIYSARYASSPVNPNASDAENNAKLLRELAGVPVEKRGARFVSAIAAAKNGETIATFRGIAEGRILTQPRGNGGFGYDPLFFFPTLSKTFAELTPEEKATVSHRAQAFRKLLQWLMDVDIR